MGNLDENVSRFMAAKDSARRLIEMDINGSLDNIAKTAKKNGKMEYEDIPTQQNTNRTQVNEQNSAPQINKTVINNTKSKLPKEILESFAKNNIDTSMLGVGVGQSSILDQLDSMTNGKVFENTPKRREIVTENVQQQVNSQIDYSLIKSIVEECVKKYASALNKKIVNESKSMLNENKSTNNLAAMKIGDKFSFIDNGGNLYEAKLTFIKNINQKKRA